MSERKKKPDLIDISQDQDSSENSHCTGMLEEVEEVSQITQNYNSANEEEEKPIFTEDSHNNSTVSGEMNASPVGEKEDNLNQLMTQVPSFDEDDEKNFWSPAWNKLYGYPTEDDLLSILQRPKIGGALKKKKAAIEVIVHNRDKFIECAELLMPGQKENWLKHFDDVVFGDIDDKSSVEYLRPLKAPDTARKILEIHNCLRSNATSAIWYKGLKQLVCCYLP